MENIETKNKDRGAFTIIDHNYIQEGLTKREYFAAKAMQGVMSSSIHGVPVNFKRGAEIAVEWADELIKALEL
jgi:hypothetical protein